MTMNAVFRSTEYQVCILIDGLMSLQQTCFSRAVALHEGKKLKATETRPVIVRKIQTAKEDIII